MWEDLWIILIKNGQQYCFAASALYTVCFLIQDTKVTFSAFNIAELDVDKTSPIKRRRMSVVTIESICPYYWTICRFPQPEHLTYKYMYYYRHKNNVFVFTNINLIIIIITITFVVTVAMIT